MKALVLVLAAVAPRASPLVEGPSVVVVGGGVGGLAVAGRLARRGASVTVLEKNDVFGGRVAEWRAGGARFEVGASLLLLPDVYESSLRALGDVEPFEARRVTPSYSVFFDDDDDDAPQKFELGGSGTTLDAQLDSVEVGASERYAEYLSTAKEYLRAGWPLFVEERLGDAPKFLPRFLRTALRKWPLESHDAHLRRFFRSPKLRALLSFNDLYVGLTPTDAPAVFSLLAAIELGVGVFYLDGGLQRYVDRLVAACERTGSVDLRLNANVDKILLASPAPSPAAGEEDDEPFFFFSRVLKKPRVRGVSLEDGTEVLADYVVVNADLATAEPWLLRDDDDPDDRRRSKGPRRGLALARSDYRDARYSTSSHTFLFALDRTLPHLSHHNVFLAAADPGRDRGRGGDPYRAAWDWAFVGDKEYDEKKKAFHFYVCAASRTDPTAAPEGGDAIMVLVPSPPLADDEKHDPARAAAVRAAVLDRLEKLCGWPLEPHITHERLVPPDEWRTRFGLRRGAVFGFSHGLDQLALFRPARKSSNVDGLAFVGASTRPGNGVPLVLTSAALCAKEVA
eukprot:CAMPEP_0118897366 /NCGR_PEP_ID=MMETSP1166-20130328/4793_1 /TAXON_ID=1104430 /ORGANISM="Chrysoreinhardia sp, Strain CCMP3193" /LENGTH=566 /DNA_ID=CAMNT_0006836435 /DNA_START=75 /DNA_END=1772 /DNA_ORIENTATION=+